MARTIRVSERQVGCVARSLVLCNLIQGTGGFVLMLNFIAFNLMNHT